MLTEKQINEIKEHLERAQNPLFLFDNDSDGLCSFLLLQRYIKRGKGFPIRSFPGLTASYIKRAKDLNSDYIFILDKPVVSKEFFEEIEKINLPVVWIDHHKVQVEIPKFISYYNPYYNEDEKDRGIEPVTALCYQITNKKEDMWISVAGCIADYYIPEVYSEFKEKYPELALSNKTDNPFEIYLKSDIGKIARIFNYALKDKTTNVVNMIKFLMKIKTPYDVLEETSKNYSMHKRFQEINRKYSLLLDKAKKIGNSLGNEDILFFKYSGDMSISSELSNELIYCFPDKLVIVVYVSGIKANISGRGKNIHRYILEAIKDLDGATGGGHENAVGAQARIEDLDKFRENLYKINYFHVD